MWPIFGSEIAFTILENLRESIPFILLGNIASSLKFELISRKIGLVFFRVETWYAWTFSLPSTWLQLPWWKIVRCFKSGCITETIYCFQSSEALGGFWSFFFICIFKSKLLCMQSRLTKSEGRNIKPRCYDESWNSDSGTSNVFSETTPWLQTPMTRNSTAIMPMDIHKQAIEKKMSPSWIQKTSCTSKGNEKRLETLFTHYRLNIYLQTSFYCGFDRYKVMDCFQVQLVK